MTGSVRSAVWEKTSSRRRIEGGFMTLSGKMSGADL